MSGEGLAEQMARFRALVAEGIERALALDPVHKLYEGRVEFTWRLPGRYDQDPRSTFQLTLHCYVLGPGREYTWEGTEIGTVFAEAMRDVSGFIADLGEERCTPLPGRPS